MDTVDAIWSNLAMQSLSHIRQRAFEKVFFECFFFFFFFFISAFLVVMATNQTEKWTKNNKTGTGQVEEHFVRVLSKYLQPFNNKGHISIFSL